MAKLTIQERFWSKVDRSGKCWLWTASRNSSGYGKFDGEGAHRVAWRLAYGVIPYGACVLHRCDMPRCVNPAHLWLGTQADNVADMVAKGRQRKPKAVRPPLTQAQIDRAELRWARGEFQ